METHIDLGNTPRSRGNWTKGKSSQTHIIFTELSLPLVDLNEHIRLIVYFRCEDFTFPGRDGLVSLNDGRHHTPSDFDSQSKWRDIQ
mmetsp:Transcript_147/g.255  ORF Transcript_147/g.255 Transcript_147/m.255 type:complete len:87 (-) Transcript_147:526-786(-)